MKRRIIWLVILPWSSGLYFLRDENSYQGWDALEAADFRMGATRRQVRDQPCIWRRFFTPMLTFLKGVTSSRIFVEYHRWKYLRFWEFYAYLLMCWQVLIYLRRLLAWNYCCCTSELWIYTTVLASLFILFLWNSFWKLQILVVYIEALWICSFNISLDFICSR